VAYEVVVSGAAARQAAGMPAAARTALAEALDHLAADPWSGEPYDAKWSPEFRTTTFGESGLLAYVVLERRRQVVIEHVTWIG
jgi:hypothetical protein